MVYEVKSLEEGIQITPLKSVAFGGSAHYSISIMWFLSFLTAWCMPGFETVVFKL